MKNILFLAVILTASVAAFAQDIEPSKMTFSYPQVLASQRTQNRFYYGWNIVQGPQALSYRYKLNSLHGGHHFEFWDGFTNLHPMYIMPDSLDLIFILDTLGRQYRSPLDASAQMWHPWLPSAVDGAFKPFGNDKTGASLPFLTRNNSIGQIDSTTQSGNTIYRWKLRKDTTQTGAVQAFSRPVLGNEFIYKPDTRYAPLSTANGYFFDTRAVYLSVNLRRADIDTLNNDDTVLVIKLPCKRHHATAWQYLSFDSVPNPLSLISHSRGQRRPLVFNGSDDLTKFVVTRRMIPRTNTPQRDITLSAFFFADTNTHLIGTTVYRNPPFSVRWGGEDSTRIDSIGMEVQYYPRSTGVSLRWLKIETPSAQRLFWGSQDSGIIKCINWRMSRLNDFNNNFNRHNRIKRFYFLEEFTASLWLTERYINRIVDTLAASEGDVYHEPQMQHTTLLRDNWSGQTLLLKPSAAAPYSNQALNTWEPIQNDAKRIDIQSRQGGVTLRNCGGCEVQFHKDYELQFRKPAHPYWYDSSDVLSLPLPAMSEEDFHRQFIDESDSTPVTSVQHGIERLLTSGEFLSPTSYIFKAKPWWANLWVGNFSKYNYVNNLSSSPQHFRSLTYERARMMTGEEVRFSLWNSVLLGAKGFYLYNGSVSWSEGLQSRDNWDALDPSDIAGFNIDLGIAPNTNERDPRITTNTNLILDDPDIGTDWLDTTGRRNDFFTQSLRRYYKYSDSTYRAKLNMDSIYVGFRSMRHSIDQAFSSFRSFDTTLMKLQLVSWYAKGMRKHVLGDTALLLRYIDTNRIRHIVQKVNYGGVRDSWDSSFYDITLHRHANYSSDTLIYVGIQNRRTNSLIYFAETGDTVWKSMREFQEWDTIASRHYSQLGARRIYLPFHYRGAGADSTLYALLRVKELGGTLDTIINANATLPLNFQPGEGKILEVRALLPDKDISGYLTFSNQRKMVKYNYIRPDGSVSNDSVVYHLAYHRPDSLGVWRVWYRRSLPTNMHDDNANTRWLPEMVLSDSMYNGSELMRTDCMCKYPSISVVPYNNGLGEHGANVVFACNPGGNVQRNFIVEARVVQKANIIRVVKNVLSFYDGRNLDEWGTPMIAATSGAGLFYAWSDSLHPIQTLRKVASTDSYQPWMRDSVDFFEGNLLYNLNHPMIAQHPSINSYPDSGAVYENAALVWQQYMATPAQAQTPPYPTIPYTGTWQTCYTRIGYVSSQMQHYLPPNLWYPYNVTINWRNNVAQLSMGCSDNLLPTVQRINGYIDTTGGRWVFDNVYWEHRGYDYGLGDCLGRNDALLSESRIEKMAVAIRDSMNGNQNVGAFNQRQWIEYFPPRAAQFRKPNVAQGYHDSFWGTYNSLNFEFKDTLGTHGKSYHLDDFAGEAMLFNSSGIGKLLSGGAETPQLAAAPKYLYPIRKWENRRVVERFDMLHPQDPPRITGTLEYFYRVNGEEERYKARNLMGFAYTIAGNGNSESCLVSMPEDEDGSIGFERKSQRELQNSFLNPPDSLCSDWFRIGNRKRVGFYLQSTDSNIARMELVRRRDGRRVSLERFMSPRRNYPYKVYQFTNGNNEEYRLVLRKNYVYAKATGRTVIGSLGGGMLGKDGEKEQEELINLSEGEGSFLNVYPNPADGYVLVRFDRLKDEGTGYEVGIYTQLGKRVYWGRISSGETQRIETGALVSGVYRIEVRRNGQAVSLPMVIVR